MSLNEETINNIKEMLSIEQKIKDLNEALKKYRSKKSRLEKAVKNHMIVTNLQKVKLPNGIILSTYTTKRRQGCSKKWVKDRLELYCHQRNYNYNDLNDFIYNPEYRTVKEVTCLRKIKPKKKN
jgi:hypothetical protein